MHASQSPNFAPADIERWTDVKLLHIFVSPGHDYWVRPGTATELHGSCDVQEVRCVEGKGLEGDRYFRGKSGKIGQVTFFDAAVVEQIREQFDLPDLSASVFRRNLVIRGARLGDWLGRRFIFQDVIFEGVQECRPCVWMDRKVADGVQRFMREQFRGGLRARICSTGWLRRPAV